MYSTTPHEDFRPNSFRPGNWRLQMAEELAAGPLPPYVAPLADDIVRAASASLAGNSADEAISTALAIADGQPLAAAEIEGRVISGQTDAEIADAMNLPAETVAAYVALCFDIRHLINCREMLQSIAAGGIATSRATQPDKIRWAGFCRGEWLVGKVAKYFRLGFDGRRITATAGLDAETIKDFRVVRKWLKAIGPIKDPIAVLYRMMCYRKREVEECRRVAGAIFGG